MVKRIHVNNTIPVGGNNRAVASLNAGSSNIASLDTGESPDFMKQFLAALPGNNNASFAGSQPMHQPQMPGGNQVNIAQLQGVVFDAQRAVDKLTIERNTAVGQYEEIKKDYEALKTGVNGLLTTFGTVDHQKLTSIANLTVAEEKATKAEEAQTELSTKIADLQKTVETLTTDLATKTKELEELKKAETEKQEALNKEANEKAALAGGVVEPKGNVEPKTEELSAGDAAARAESNGVVDANAEYSRKYTELKHLAETKGGKHMRDFLSFCNDNLGKVGFINSAPQVGALKGENKTTATT